MSRLCLDWASLAWEASRLAGGRFGQLHLALLINRIQLDQQGIFLHHVGDVVRELDDLAGGFALDVHIEVGDDFAGGGDGQADVAALDFGGGDWGDGGDGGALMEQIPAAGAEDREDCQHDDKGFHEALLSL